MELLPIFIDLSLLKVVLVRAPARKDGVHHVEIKLNVRFIENVGSGKEVGNFIGGEIFEHSREKF